MKAKYEKMVDAWVKKHYGDLDRGVISNEMKYKILFKIYRKKYKKAKHGLDIIRRYKGPDKFNPIGMEYNTLDSNGNGVIVKITEPHREGKE